MQIGSQDVEKEKVGEPVLEVKTHDVQLAQNQPLGIEDVENMGAVPETESKPGLPFSKARCIALVLPVTCAAFLNVGWLVHLKSFARNHLLTRKCRPSVFKLQSSYYQPLAPNWAFRIVDSSGSFQRIT
jgi:hypothetical protein